MCARDLTVAMGDETPRTFWMSTGSPVLTAMGFDHDRALAAARLSVGRWTPTSDVDRAADWLTTTARQRLDSR